MIKLSICIPTYNRASLLKNCLNSLINLRHGYSIDIQICVSDNCSTDETAQVVSSAQKYIPIKYQKNDKNLGVANNVIKVVAMAEGEFVWLIGDDDLLMPYAIEELLNLIDNYSTVDYFYINSNHLTTEHVFSFPQPFDLSNLPDKLDCFSKYNKRGTIEFLDLIDPNISFDFLGGMFLAVFRREKWISNVGIVDLKALNDSRVFSYFDNTFVHVKIFASAFAESVAFFYPKPLSICLTGAREWSPMYPFVRSVRLIEALEQYRKNGLSLKKYLICKNFALRTFLPDLAYMFLNRKISGFNYINPFNHILKNMLYPNLYLSIPYYLIRKLKLN